MKSQEDLLHLEKCYKNFPQSVRVASWLNERYYIIKDNFGVLFRQQRMQPGSFHTDCIPHFWLFCFNNFQGEISYFREGKEFQLWGSKAIFIPPFSIINWKFNKEEFYWFAYEGTTPLNENLPIEPVIFNAENQLFFDEQSIFSYVSKNQPDWHKIGAKNKTSAVALRTKNFIDSHFRENLKISQISEILNYSLDVMTRQFKSMYGVTPSQYLRDLKYYQAALRITESNEPLKTIAENVGINNYENFSKVFRNIFRASPKNFREF